ncbi:hypothetical protein B808_77 [Fructilactobacillus florum 8D]|uniref:Uncharacterized protein n=2 Tax=Fructilactobacillus florum TaxID=640331 RepID=W9EMX8_9LACO|nr:hypothetical protein [Fructilactobacillus florum]ETO41004.1 hypothetical protein B808_77 [Fructilactobacillus florum 8D]KRM92276.1 hypothetical protein FC87_GL000404 [Fructilactobacillus florum DSM 22689 = JCM 16035]
MEYSKVDYLMFKLSHLFDGKIFILLVALIIIAGVIVFFTYDYRNNGPFLAEEADRKKQKGHSKKIKRTELLLAIIPIAMVLVLFGCRKAFSQAAAPDQLVAGEKVKTAAVGRVAVIDSNLGKIKIVNQKYHLNNPIIAQVNNQAISPESDYIPPFGGTTISNKQFLNLQVGDYVKIKVRPLEYKYRNHADYAKDDKMVTKLSVINSANVNGAVIKVQQRQLTNREISQLNPEQPVNRPQTVSNY